MIWTSFIYDLVNVIQFVMYKGPTSNYIKENDKTPIQRGYGYKTLLKWTGQGVMIRVEITIRGVDNTVIMAEPLDYL